MAVTVDELVLKITLSNEKTASELSRISDELKNLQNTTKKTEQGVAGFSASFAKFSVIGFAAIKTIESVVSSIADITGSFLEAEDAVTKLRQSLEIAGSRSVDASIERFRELADTIKNFGVASSDQILKLARLGTAAGQTAAQTEKLINAAADSAARDIPLEAAFKALSASLKGSSGALSNFLPELQNLTEEQNKAGFAIDYVSASLGGFAARNLETYAGKIEVLKTRFGDVGEEIGHIVADIFDLDKAVQGSTTYLGSLQNTLIQNRETFVTVGKAMAAPFIYVAEVIQGLVVSAGGAFGLLELLAGKLILSFGQLQVWTDKLAKRSTAMGDAMIRTGTAMMESGKAYTTASREMTIASEPLKDVPVVLDDTAKKAEAAAKALADMKSQIMTKDQIAAYDELKKKVVELTKAQTAAGLVGADLIRAKAIADTQEIVNLEKRIKLNGKLTADQAKAAEEAKKAIASGAQSQLDKLHMDTLDQILAKNKEIETATKSIDATRREQIQFELDKQLQLLEIEKKRIDLQDAASLEAIDRQKELLQAQAQKKADSGPSANFEGLAKIGGDVAKKISGVFSEGAMGMVGGAMSMVGAVVSAVDAMLDFFPNLINSIAGVFNKLTDFPETLFNAFQGMFDAMVRFVSDFIPKLVESIFKSFTQLKDFANNIANAISTLADQLPDIISNLIEKLPEIVVSLAENLWKAWFKILAAIYIKIPLAIMKGIIAGISKLWEGIKRLFAGKSFLPKVKVDSKSVTDAAKKLGEKLSGTSGRLFNVKDLLDSAKDPLDKVTENIEEVFKKGADWIKQAWMWVYEKILKPIWELVTKAWRWVYDNVISPILTVVQQAWQWVYDKVLAPIFQIVTSAWRWVYDNVIAPIYNLIVSAWRWVSDNVIAPIAGIITRAWTWIYDNIIMAIPDLLMKPWIWVIDNVIKPLSEIGTKIWEGLKAGLDGATNIFSNIGSQIWEGLKSGLSGIGKFLTDIFDKLNPANLFSKIFKVDMGGKGTVEKALGIDIPFMAFADGGMVPGQAKVKGDSIANDRILAMLSPGEAIIPRSKMNDPTVRALVDQILNGDLKLPQYGLGGTLGDIIKGGGDVVSGVIQDLGEAGQVVVDQVSGVAQGAGDWLGDVLNDANPLKALWQTVQDKVFKDMLLSMFKSNRFALGGPVPNVGTDTVPALLTPGEFVMSRPAVQAIGVGNLQAMNNGMSPGGDNTYNISFAINVDAKTPMDEGFIRGTLIPRMSEELKRASLDGKFVLSQKGIR